MSCNEPTSPPASIAALLGPACAVHAVLPQTQCQRCTYADCAGYAQAIAAGKAEIDQCAPGGTAGIARIAQALGQPQRATGQTLNPEYGQEMPMTVAVIDEAWCIGCTLCIKACPTDAIVGSNKRMHTVIERYCTGCDLCVLACPVDCIAMEPVSGERTGWDAWSAELADQALQRYTAHQLRVERAERENTARLQAEAEKKRAHLEDYSRHTDAAVLERKRVVLDAVLQKARARRPPDPA